MGYLLPTLGKTSIYQPVNALQYRILGGMEDIFHLVDSGHTVMKYGLIVDEGQYEPRFRDLATGVQHCREVFELHDDRLCVKRPFFVALPMLLRSGNLRLHVLKNNLRCAHLARLDELNVVVPDGATVSVLPDVIQSEFIRFSYNIPLANRLHQTSGFRSGQILWRTRTKNHTEHMSSRNSKVQRRANS